MKKTLTNKWTLLLLTGLLFINIQCSEGDKFDHNKSVILVTGTDANPLVTFVVEDTPASYYVTASATGKVSEDVFVTYSIDNSALEEYNQKNKTNYYMVPSSAIKGENLQDTIKSGRASSSGVKLQIVSTDDFVDGRVYVLPVTIKDVKGGTMEVLNASRTIFLRISRTISFPSLDVSNSNLYSNFIFNDALGVDLPKYTCEIRCFLTEDAPNRIRRMCSWTGKNEEKSNMLRFGEEGQHRNSLQWVSPGGSIVSKTLFTPNRWYTVSLTFDGSRYTMYVDGVKDSELAGTTPFKFQRFEIGMSWANYPSQQLMRGRIAEVRLWNRALAPSEIKVGNCAVDPHVEGLVAYWKFNEGNGAIFRDATGHGYDMDWSKTVRDNAGNGTLNPFDKSSYVVRVQDELNKCN